MSNPNSSTINDLLPTDSFASNSTMPPPLSAPPFSLTLILAATPSLGIGKAGTLPWPQLRKEMGYFKRVTLRVPPRAGEGARRRINAVVMGRKTWDSIPERFRPLDGRLNFVVTRRPEAFSSSKKEESGREGGEPLEGPIAVESVGEAVERLQAYNLPLSNAKDGKVGQPEIERVFVIGGATIYDAALKLPQTDRVLLTKIRNEFECDTFFSVDLNKDSKWKRSSQEALEEFTGEKIEPLEENGLQFEFRMYESAKGGDVR